MPPDLFKTLFASENLQNIRDSFFKKIEKAFNLSPKDIEKDTKTKTNNIISNAEINSQ